ncbi:energy transducer TonB [Aureispira anguillae]|nr:energy transducer TonB [Aureispira anguillae]
MKTFYCFIFLLFYSSWSWAQDNNSDNALFTVVEQMPRFAGCEALEEEQAKKSCADQKLLQYIYTNIRVPPHLDKTIISSKLVISFIVDKQGQVIEPTIIRSVHPDLDALYIDLVKNMPKWIPGKHNGKAVNVKIMFPIQLCFR